MATGLSTDFGDLIAQRIKAAHREIAQRWLGRLEALLPVHTNDIFPTDQILDHIPALIDEIADYVGTPATDPLVANTLVFSKARELGELRFSQKASVHQLLREYRILAAVLGTFVQEQFDALAPSSHPGEVVGVVNRLNEAVFVLLQTTVDTFVGRYARMIEDQTTRLDGFNRMVSHELRQPLTSIQYAVELLKNSMDDGSETRERFLEVADRNVKRLSQLLGMLSALAQPDQDNPQLQSVDLSKVVEEVLRQLREAAQMNGVSLKSAVETRRLEVDVSRLELVLVNLVSNGIKYRDPRKPDPFVEVSLLGSDADCRLQVRDNGLGIPPQDQPKIFSRFYRAHTSRDAELGNDGVGLGLAIAAECVRGMRGSLTFESVEGLGTTFTLTLPAEPTPGT